jgi:precorrin-2/cobalt-factor-2 C20-methyltransferase
LGTLFGLGLGPGDPELITVKAERMLRRIPVVCVPKARAEGSSYARSIVNLLIDPDRQRVVELVFPMTSDKSVLERYWDRALEKIVTFLVAGLDVAFVTEGDPMVHSTFIPIHQLISERYPCLAVEIVPGVTSMCAAAAAARVPLVNNAERLAIIPAVHNADRLADALGEFETVVFLKVNRVFDRLVKSVEERHPAKGAVYVSKCGTADQEIVWNISDLNQADVPYLSLVIVRNG